MNLEQKLLSLPVEQWTTRQALVFDWYDGPRAGVCWLDAPAVEFAFDLLDERRNEDAADDRLFRLNELPEGSVAEILSILQPLGQPAGPLWSPVWRFSDHDALQKAEEQLRQVMSRSRPTTVVVYTHDMVEFLGCWNIPFNGRDVADWFAELNVPRKQLA